VAEPLAALPPITVAPPPPSDDFLAVDQICRAAESAGWPTKVAFQRAMQKRAAGVSTDTAVALFQHAGLWVQ
jgi:hypothetical protein